MDAPQASLQAPAAELAQAKARRSFVAAMGLAVAAHLGLFAALIQIVILASRDDRPELIVAAPFSPQETKEQPKQLAHLKSDKPSAPSGARSQAVTARAIAPVPMPEIDNPLEHQLDLGSGWGEGFGAGLGGAGFGRGASFFGTPAGGKSVVLVIDVSTSMPRNLGSDGIAALRKEIERTVLALSPAMRFNLICFGAQADGFQERPVPASSANKKAALRFMEDYFTGKFQRTRTEEVGKLGELDGVRYVAITPEDFELTRGTSGGSRYDLALIAAFMQHPEVIFLLTDGDPGTQKDGDRLSLPDILDLVKAGADKASPTSKPLVHCISVNGVGGEYLREIAKAFKGNYKEIKPSDI